MWSQSLLSWSSGTVMRSEVAPCLTKSWRATQNAQTSGRSLSILWSSMGHRRTSGKPTLLSDTSSLWPLCLSVNIGCHKLTWEYDHVPLAGSCLIAWSIWVFQWKRSSSSSSAIWSTRRSTAPHRASRQSKRRPSSLWKLKATKLPNDDQTHTSDVRTAAWSDLHTDSCNLAFLKSRTCGRDLWT